MSQKNPSDGAHKGFAVGRGLLAAAETLNFSMSGSRPSYGMSSVLGSGDKNRNSQLPPRGGGHVSNTMKLFDSLGLSPTDIDALAQIPEENISIETLPQLIRQLKNRKMEAGRRMGGGSRDLPPISPDHSYRASPDDWEDLPAGRMGASPGQVSARGPQMDYGYGSMQGGPSRGYKGIDCGDNSGGGMGRDRQYSELSRERYGGLGMGPSPASDGGFLQKRMGSPSQGKVQDFLGVMPRMFPHVCSLCDFDVHSMMEWNQHINGLRHAENRRQLVQMYPDWDPRMDSNRGSGSHALDSTNRSDGILGPAPMGPPRGGMSSNWGSGMSNPKHPLLSTPKMRSRIVVAETEGKPIILNKLLSLAQPFGTVRQHLVRINKAYLEMQNHEEAAAMVNCFQEKPPMMHGRPISVSLSWERFPFDKGNRDGGRQSRVVFFSNLPREREKKNELLTVARRFGTVEKYLFLNEQAFVQLGTPEDAEMMVKYYTLHPLTIKGRSIRLNICEKYKTLIVNPARHTGDRDDSNRKSSSSTNRKGSPKRTKSKVASAKKEGEVEDEDSALLEEGPGEEVSGVIEADEGDPGEAAETQEAEPVDIPDEAMIEEGDESSTKKEEPVPDGDETGNTGEETGEVPPSEGSKEATGEEPPSEGKTAPAEGESSPDDVGAQGNVASTEPTEKTETIKEDPEEDPEMAMEQDFPEDMEDFVTLDEVAEEEDGDGLDPLSKSGDADSESSGKKEGLKVVRLVGLKRGYNFLDEILALAKPFGKVVRYLVLDIRPEAFLELSSEEEARAMVSFYRSNVTPTVCGRPVKVYHSQTHSSIHSGRVVYVGHISLKTSDAALLKIAEPYGKVKRYYLNRPRCECFIEMEKGQDAERMARAYKENPPKLHDQRLTVYVSRKYKQLRNGVRPPPPEPEEERPGKRERDEGSPAKSKAKKEGEPPAKKICIKEEKSTPAEANSSIKEEENAATEEPSSNGEPHQQEEEEKGASETPGEEEALAGETGNEDVNTSQLSESMDTQEEDTEGDCEGNAAPSSSGASVKTCEGEEAPSTKSQAEKKPAPTSLPLGPYQPNNPVGVEFVKMGYYCRVCFLFYSNEETAKKVHCSSQSHYQKLKKHLQKEKGKEKEKQKAQ